MKHSQSPFNKVLTPYAIAILVLLSRIPFLWNGYGTEEDSWGLVVNSWDILNVGHYVFSRLPGHPIQELLLALFPFAGPFVYNLFSALFSAITVFFFVKILQWYQLKNVVLAALTLAFTPVFFISSTYTIDYCYALAFILAAYYGLLKGNSWIAAILLGFAVGCRLTSGLMVIPFALLIVGEAKKKPYQKLLIFALLFAFSALFTYAPALYEYGLSVIGTYKLPYPPLAKALYKGSIGVWGVMGCLALLVALIAAWRNRKKTISLFTSSFNKKLHISVWVLSIVLQLLIFLRLPEKSAFLIPALPFLILLVASTIKSSKAFIAFCILTIIAPFIISVNISDSNRGADYSSTAMIFKMSGQEIFIDPLNGPIFSDYSKRKNKAAFCKETLAIADTLGEPAVILCGWWYNELYVDRMNSTPQRRIHLTAYLEEDALKYYTQQGIPIYYLPETDLINNRRCGKDITALYAKPLFVE